MQRNRIFQLSGADIYISKYASQSESIEKLMKIPVKHTKKQTG